MTVFGGRPDYRPGKELAFNWDTFRGGLNTLLRENEISKNELSQAENIILKGKGIPTKRWGTAVYHQAGNATGSVRGLKGLYYANGNVELLGLTDDGYLTVKSGASYSTLTGASWASGNDVYMAQLENSMYIVNGQRELVRYSTPTLTGFPTIGLPVVTGATNISNATGSTVKGYRVSAVSQVGETLASGTFELPSQPETIGDPAGGTIRLFITPPSTASGVLQGMNIYGRNTGSERYLGFLSGNATVFNDDGSSIPRDFTFPPTADSTGGPIAKYVKRFQDRLVFAGLAGEPTKLLISGKAPYQERFDVSFGGNFIEIEPDAGDDIRQVEIFNDRIIVFKEKSIWQVTLSTEQIGNFFVTTPNAKLITASHGCIAPRSVVAVENDIFFLSRKGVNTLGYESGFAFDTLRSNELSVKVRNFFENLTTAQKETAAAVYFNFKYLITFPGLGKTMVFDRERNAWTGPWTNDARLYEVFYDASNDEHLLYGNDTTAFVDEYSTSFMTDKGSAIETILRTRLEDFGDWSLFKNIKDIFFEFTNINGSADIDIRLEKRSGSVVSAQNLTVTPNTGNSGFGADIWATALWGDSNEVGGGADTLQTIRWRRLHDAARTMSITISTSDADSNYELLGIRGNAYPMGTAFRPNSWKI